MFTVKEATSQAELQTIIELRYAMLGKPWDAPKKAYSDELDSQSINAYIANESGQMIACGRLQKNTNTLGQIRFMAVDDANQGKGLGRLILEYLEERGRALNLAVIELQAREKALGFYEGCGYRVKEKTFLLWGSIQHYLMEKRL